DVVLYRQEWAKQMLEYRRKMETYEGDEMEKVNPPTELNEGEKKLVLVTHDECTFYSNDVKKTMWLKKGESVIRKKGQGGSLMVSDFLCPCHGPLRLPAERAAELQLPEEAREIIEPGKSRDGWWKSDNMVKQLEERAIPIFNALHPGCVGKFSC